MNARPFVAVRGTLHPFRLPALWAAYALVVSGPMLFGNHLQSAEQYSLGYPLTLSALAGAFWTAVAVLLDPVVARFPISRARWLLAALIHVSGLVLAVSGLGRLCDLVTTGFGMQGNALLMHSVKDYSNGIAIQLYVITVAVISILQSQRRAQQAEAAQHEAQRLSAGARSLALRSQLNAHFLFNTLNTVAMAIRRSDRDEALSIVVALGSLLRTVLRQTTTELVPLSAEIDFVTRYLEIEQARFNDRLRVEWLIASDVRGAAVPALILQPVVENALRHGIEKRSDAGLVRIRASRIGDSMEIVVVDDGPGFDPSWTPGVGLDNVRDRLQIHFGSRARLDVIDLARGASVRLSLPMTDVTANA